MKTQAAKLGMELLIYRFPQYPRMFTVGFLNKVEKGKEFGTDHYIRCLFFNHDHLHVQENFYWPNCEPMSGSELGTIADLPKDILKEVTIRYRMEW